MRSKIVAIDTLADRLGITRDEARNVFTQIANAVRATLRAGDKAVLPGLGAFEIIERGPRMMRNFHMNTSILVPARKRVKFKPSIEFQDFE